MMNNETGRRSLKPPTRIRENKVKKGARSQNLEVRIFGSGVWTCMVGRKTKILATKRHKRRKNSRFLWISGWAQQTESKPIKPVEEGLRRYA